MQFTANFYSPGSTYDIPIPKSGPLDPGRLWWNNMGLLTSISQTMFCRYGHEKSTLCKPNLDKFSLYTKPMLHHSSATCPYRMPPDLNVRPPKPCTPQLEVRHGEINGFTSHDLHHDMSQRPMWPAFNWKNTHTHMYIYIYIYIYLFIYLFIYIYT